MASRLDIILFGATGFTGKITVRQLHKFCTNGGRCLTWGVAGRSEQKLKSVLAEAAEEVGVKDLSRIPLIIADLADENSIKKMTARAKVIINCCGPYILYGEVVIKSCIETTTHYVDITIEYPFIRDIKIKYGEAAEKKGVYIISACGYGSVISDLGLVFLQKHFEGTINSVEIYMQYQPHDISSKPNFNYAAWTSIVEIVGNSRSVATEMRELFSNPFPQFQPKLRFKCTLHRIDDKWAVPFPAADRDIALQSELYFYNTQQKRPVQVHFYIVLKSLIRALLLLLGLLVGYIVCRFGRGKRFLLKNPRLFTIDLISNASTSPSNEVVRHQQFCFMFYGKGWSERLAEVEDEYKTAPNKMIVGRVTDVKDGYDFTSVAVVLSAIMILTESKLMPDKRGVYTPASAFSKTSLATELKKNGTVFEIVAVKDI